MLVGDGRETREEHAGKKDWLLPGVGQPRSASHPMWTEKRGSKARKCDFIDRGIAKLDYCNALLKRRLPVRIRLPLPFDDMKQICGARQNRHWKADFPRT